MLKRLLDPLGLARRTITVEQELAAAHASLLQEGWSEQQVAAALSLVLRRAKSIAREASGGDPDMYSRAMVNAIRANLVYARSWLKGASSGVVD